MASYATRDDLVNLGVAAQAIADVDTASQDKALAAASRLADSYLGSRFKLPLLAWEDDLRGHVCAIAAWRLLSGTRGFNPEQGSNVSIRTSYEDAIDWLKCVAKGTATPAGILASESPSEAGPASAFVGSSPKRGW